MNIYDVFQPMNNATSTVSQVGNVFSIILMIGVCVAVLSILFYVSGNIEKYRRFKKLFQYLYRIFSYAAYGLLTIAVIGLPLLGVYQLSQMISDNPSGAIETAKTVGIIFGAFVGVTLVGYATKNRIWKRIFKFHIEEKEKKVEEVETNV